MYKIHNLSILFFFCFFSYFLLAQDSNKQFKEDVFLLMKDNSTSKTRKKVRRFFRILRSNELSDQTRSKIHMVLHEFDNRGLLFNAHYVKFFNLFLEAQENNKTKSIFNDLLDYLIANRSKYTDQELKYLFSDIENFLKFNILNKGDGFSWKCVGDFNFFFNLNGNPNFYFSENT